MNISAGLVGLPNVGKSTLFNALTKSSVPAENYPFCTIDPHMACTPVPDKRIPGLLEIYKSQKTIYNTVQFYDIAGLVSGASKGEGLGNQFLGHIRDVNLILHVLRCFEDADIIRTQGAVNPLQDFDTIATELMLKDLDSIEKRLAKIEQLIRAHKPGSKEYKELEDERSLLKKVTELIDKGSYKEVYTTLTTSVTKTVPLLCAKKFLIIANIHETELENNAFEQNPHVQTLRKAFGKDLVIPVCARVELELSKAHEHEAAELASLYGLSHSALGEIIRQTFTHLGLISFFTCGPKEMHSWTVTQGTTVRKAAGEIHSDLERGFICAEVYNAQDILTHKTEARLRDLGLIRIEGQDYIVKDGDILNIRFNV